MTSTLPTSPRSNRPSASYPSPEGRRRASARATAKKREWRLRQNVKAFVEDHGLERCAVLTLTFDHDVTQQQVRRAKKNLCRHLLDHYFLPHISVVAFTERGRPHLHLLLAARTGNWRGDFNFAAYGRRNEIVRDAYHHGCRLTLAETQERRLLGRQLNRTVDLETCWKDLRRQLPRLGFGRRYPGDLAPVKDAAALGAYLAKQLAENRPHVPRDTRSVSPVTYPRSGWKPPFGRQFAWNTPRAKDGRVALGTICTALGASNDEAGMVWMKEVYGPKWCHHAGILMEDLSLHHGLCPSRWPVDEIRTGAEMVMNASRQR